MVRPIHLNNAPITEALIDIFIIPPHGFDVMVLENLHNEVIEDYPKKQIRKFWEGSIEVSGGDFQKTTSTQGLQGFWFLSDKGDRIFQARTDGFTYNKIKPYETWQNMRDEAMKLWGIYSKNIQPQSIRKVGLRYINRIEVPTSNRELGDYLTAPPQIPQELPQEVVSFLSRIQIYNSSISATGFITHNFASIEGDIAPVILDIEVVHEGPFDANEGVIWTTLERLRDFKNDIFFSSITEEVVRLCS